MKVFIWRNEKGKIEVAFEKFPNVPETAQEFDVESLDWIMFDEALGEFRVKTEDEMIRDKKAEKLSQLKSIVYALLQPTDWVVTKCTELGLDIAVAYPEVKQKRDAVRAWNNQKENEINNATTVEELNSISLEFGR